jgi:alanine racemase
MLNTASARIDLQALRENLSIVRRLCPRSRVMAMIKANAYGHGLIPVAQALTTADGLAVARLAEAMLLRRSGIAQRILLLGTILDEEGLQVCSEQNIDVTAHDEVTVARITAHARRAPLRVWLKLDSGMHRVGLDRAAFIAADRTLSRHPGVVELTHMTHFSSADEASTAVLEEQVSCFLTCRRACSSAEASLANSAALISEPQTHADWVRPGIMLYGDNPVSVRHPAPVQAAMTLSARVVSVRNIAKGESVGYNRTWTSNRASRIGTLGIGYGDGYPRHAKNGTPVWINGRLAPLAGRVSMDSLTVDLTDCDRVSVGDEAVLWGPELPVSVVAGYADTIAHELLSSVSQRVSRQYVT